MSVYDCLADEVVKSGLDALTAAALCGSMGGNKCGYYVVPDDKPTSPPILDLFGECR